MQPKNIHEEHLHKTKCNLNFPVLEIVVGPLRWESLNFEPGPLSRVPSEALCTKQTNQGPLSLSVGLADCLGAAGPGCKGSGCPFRRPTCQQDPQRLPNEEAAEIADRAWFGPSLDSALIFSFFFNPAIDVPWLAAMRGTRGQG
jgi:hypothetical protein